MMICTKTKPIRLTDEGIARLTRLERSCFPYDDPYPCDKGYWWVTEHNGEDAAFAGIKILPEGAGFLCRAGVLKPFRGLGLHRALIQVRVRKAKKLGLKCVITYTVSSNPKSMNNLIKSGFTLYAPAYRYAGDVLYWRRDFKKD